MKDYMQEFNQNLVESNITFQDMNNEESRFNIIHQINDIKHGKLLDSINNSSMHI